MSENPSVRVRFAPSPTGYLHVGGVRTALFNYLYAKGQGGKFLLRIEDTDRLRSNAEFENEILQSMKWLGLDWDEEIVYQSRRLARYQEISNQLIQKGFAYEKTDDGKSAVVFKMPSKQIFFADTIRGNVSFDTQLFDDLVIMKSDGFPTYHFANVVDDHDMEISHVIRGEDHLSNTPRQVLLYEAMGWKPPKYAHLPLILGHDGTPLSKRHGAVAASSYREEGYLASGLLNYLALLGWGDANEDFFTLDQVRKKFSLKKVNKAGAKYDLEKLEWLNGRHIKALPKETYIRLMSDYYSSEKEQFTETEWKALILLYQARVKTLRQLKDEANYVFQEIAEYDKTLIDELLKEEQLPHYLEACLVGLVKCHDFLKADEIEKNIRETAEFLHQPAKVLIHPLRFALTGKTVSPGLFELMVVLGRQSCIDRISRLLSKLRRD